MANESRGEVEIALDSKTYTLRPEFQGLAEIESRTGQKLGVILRQWAEGDIGITELAIVVWCGMRAFDERSPSFEEVGQMIVVTGLAPVAGPAARFLAGAVAGLNGLTPGAHSA